MKKKMPNDRFLVFSENNQEFVRVKYLGAKTNTEGQLIHVAVLERRWNDYPSLENIPIDEKRDGILLATKKTGLIREKRLDQLPKLNSRLQKWLPKQSSFVAEMNRFNFRYGPYVDWIQVPFFRKILEGKGATSFRYLLYKALLYPRYCLNCVVFLLSFLLEIFWTPLKVHTDYVTANQKFLRAVTPKKYPRFYHSSYSEVKIAESREAQEKARKENFEHSRNMFSVVFALVSLVVAIWSFTLASENNQLRQRVEQLSGKVNTIEKTLEEIGTALRR